MTTSYEEVLDLFRETERMFRETDRKFQETDRKFQETDRKFQEMREALQHSSLETERMFRETDRKIAALSKNIGDIGNRLGDFVEDMVEPAVVRLFQERGVEVHLVNPRHSESRNGEKFEVDLLVVNDGEAIAVECKSRPSIEDVSTHIERLKKIRRVSSTVRDKRLIGAIAGMSMWDEVKDFARQQGFYVLVQNGNNIKIDNPKDFSPTYW